MLLLTCIFITHIFYVNSEIYEKNLTDFSKCKLHYSKSESSYTQFFQITDEHRQNSSLEFDFHFSVLAPSDAHILVAPSNKFTRQDPVYEIVLGAGGNTFSDIRRLQKAQVKRSTRTKNLLSNLDIRSFWMHISKDGYIQVGRETEEIAFLSWRDPDPLPVQVFSFSTWPGIDAKWFFDCRRDGNESSSEEIENPVSDLMRLKKQIFSYYDPYVRPVLNDNDLTVIYIKFFYERISLDEKESKMSIRGIMNLEWKDEKISWNSSDFGDIEKIHMFFREIWQPNLVVLNAASGTGSDFLRSTYIEVNEVGNVFWKASVENLEVWCDVSNIGSNNWPKDQHDCEVQLGFLAQQDKFLIKIDVESRRESSEWNVLEVSSEPIDDSKDTILGTSSIKFKLQRYSTIYTATYYAPLITVSVTMLITFCLSTNGPARIGLNCLQLSLLCLFMGYLSIKIPSTSSAVPYIILLYSNGVIASLISLAVNVFIINITRVKREKPIPKFLYKIISSYYLTTFILSFGFLKSSDSYDNLGVGNSTDSDIGPTETWKLLGHTIDRIMFVIYSLLIAIYLFQNY